MQTLYRERLRSMLSVEDLLEQTIVLQCHLRGCAVFSLPIRRERSQMIAEDTGNKSEIPTSHRTV
jgi:hypothetical protein